MYFDNQNKHIIVGKQPSAKKCNLWRDEPAVVLLEAQQQLFRKHNHFLNLITEILTFL